MEYLEGGDLKQHVKRGMQVSQIVTIIKQIASALNISEITVKIHRGRVMDKMGVDSVVALVRLTEKVGIEPSKTHI